MMNFIEVVKWMMESPNNIAVSPSGYQIKMDKSHNFMVNITNIGKPMWVYKNSFLLTDYLGEWNKWR